MAEVAEKKEKKEKQGFFKGIAAEFKKVIWPDKASVARQTITVIVCTVIIGVLVKLLDTGVAALIELIA